MNGSDIRIVPVTNKAERDRFIAVANRINAHDPNYVVPLWMERRDALSASKNPFFAHADVRLWLAVRGGRDVGRVSAQIDHLAPDNDGIPTGHFGFIAADDDAAIFAALFGTAEAWLRSKGCRRVLGPFNLSINEEVGLLVDGFETRPMIMMGHDPAYVDAQVRAQGYARAKDVYAYISPMDQPLPAPVKRRLDRGVPDGLVLRQLEMKRYAQEVSNLTSILNDAWSGNWGFTPVTEAETRQLAKTMRPVIEPRLAWFAEIDGDTAGFIVLLPNVNEAIAGLNGRLLPFGWLKLLWRLKVRGVGTARVPLMGVKRRYARTVRGMLAPFHLIHAARTEALKLGYTSVEMSWVLEDNAPMLSILEAVGARSYKTYRIYEKALV